MEYITTIGTDIIQLYLDRFFEVHYAVSINVFDLPGVDVNFECVRPLDFDHSYQIRIKNLPNTLFTFPLSNTLCSQMICEYGVPLNLSNEHDFCGKKVKEMNYP
ncbi:unnamed protein product [Rotaria sp. Silwood1]|nr:unnamed protein product [Rotaria sp. Silwood1]